VDELNGKMLACQIMMTVLIARVAETQADPVGFVDAFRTETMAVISGIRIEGLDDVERMRTFAMGTANELLSLIRPLAPDA
jgi:hypothetical protein